MKLLSVETQGQLIKVRVSITHSWIERTFFGKKDRVDEVIFNTKTGMHSTSVPICKGAFKIALHEKFKLTGTYR